MRLPVSKPKIVFITLICLFRISTAHSQPLLQSLNHIFIENELVGMNVVVVKKGIVIDTLSFGLSDVSRNIPATCDTKFRVASVSKMITTIALMQLYQQKLFQLDDDISNYLGYEVRNSYYPDVPITFRMLLTHTSGIHDGDGYNNKFIPACFRGDTLPPSLQELLQPGGKFFTPDIFYEKKPGDFFSYANLNFVILGTLVEKISGERFDQYCLSHILKPLEMNASFDVHDISEMNKIGVLYETDSSGNLQAAKDDYKGVAPAKRDLSQYRPGLNAMIFSPNGGLRCSPNDLARLMQMEMNNGNMDSISILNSASMTEIKKMQWLTNGNAGEDNGGNYLAWGLGLHEILGEFCKDEIFRNHRMMGHSGDAYGLLSDIYFDNEKNGIIFICNGARKNYRTGIFSEFYRVEEEVFGAIYQSDFAPEWENSPAENEPVFIAKFDGIKKQINLILYNNSEQTYSIQIYGADGTRVFKAPVSSFHATISVGTLEAGIYFLAVTGARGLTARQKICIGY